MTNIEKQLMKNTCANVGSTLYNSIQNTTEVIVNISVRTLDEGVTDLESETVIINNGGVI